MKKYLIFALAVMVAFAFITCSSEDEEDNDYDAAFAGSKITFRAAGTTYTWGENESSVAKIVSSELILKAAKNNGNSSPYIMLTITNWGTGATGLYSGQAIEMSLPDGDGGLTECAGLAAINITNLGSSLGALNDMMIGTFDATVTNNAFSDVYQITGATFSLRRM
jgi:hypothetical protein